MPDGSLRPPGQSPTSTTPVDSNIDITASAASRSFPLAARKNRLAVSVNETMKPKIFGSAPTSPTTARPRTGHQSVRGRISGPIPIPNPLDDDEFPIRNPGTAVASSTPIEDELRAPPPPPRQTGPPAMPSPVAESFVASPPPPPPLESQTLPEGSTMEIADVPQIPQSVSDHPATPSGRPPGIANGLSGPSPESRTSNVSGSAPRSSARIQHRTNPSSSARYSTISASEADGSTEARDGGDPPQRKRSTLRSAIGRLLRRKKTPQASLSSVNESERKIAVESPGQQQPPPQQQQHRSVPPATRANAEHEDLIIGKRVASMPISEFDRALRSHSIGPNDITAIESARNSIDALASPMLRLKAAAALQNRSITPRSRGEDWAGLSPRPASAHGHGTDDDPSAIGRAITSDGEETTYKRRSRSLSQLDHIIPVGERCRSDEIRYWRQSYDVPAGALSPISSNPSNPMDFEAADGHRPSASVAENSTEKVPKTPPQPFIFGTTGAMNEMAGMKITQAATLDERFGYLESRMSKLERIVSQLCHSVPGFKGPLGEAPAPQSQGGRQRSGSPASAKGGVSTHHVTVSQPKYSYSTAVPPMIPAIYQSDSNFDGQVGSSRWTNSHQSVDTTTDDNLSSRMSFGDGQNYMDSLHPPSSSATHGAASTVATSVPIKPGLLRPASEVTVRPATSMPSLGSDSHHNNDDGRERSSNSAALLAQLDAERAARQLLEDQVRKLSERMNNLSSTMFAIVRDPAAKSTKVSQERLRSDAATSTTANTSAKASGPECLTPMSANIASAGKPAAIAPSSKAQSIFGKDSAGLGIATSATDSPSKETHDDAFSDAFQTPREAMTPGSGLVGVFGDEFGPAAAANENDNETEEARKRAARTLSLSQLTMGKPMPERYPTMI